MSIGLEFSAFRFATIVGVAIAAHLATVLIRGASRRLLRSRVRSETKVLTVTAPLRAPRARGESGRHR